jgi:GST-like protein
MMIDFYFWTTPNGYKVFLFLEESGIPYRVIPVNISKGEQFVENFLKISPNNKIPAIVDHNPEGGGNPVALFESGAILLYLAEKTGHFIPDSIAGRTEVLQWLFWQMGGLGPSAGQAFHFLHSAPKPLPYATSRYVDETSRLFKVLDIQLRQSDFIAGEYSIADMASYPWVDAYEHLRQDMDGYPNLKRWHERIKNRPATARVYEEGPTIVNMTTVTEGSKMILSGQNAGALATRELQQSR